MSAPISVLLSMWLLVIGYGLIYIGYVYFAKGQKTSFQQAFFPSGLFAPNSGSTGGGTVPGQGGPASGNQNTNPLRGRSSGTQAFA